MDSKAAAKRPSAPLDGSEAEIGQDHTERRRGAPPPRGSFRLRWEWGSPRTELGASRLGTGDAPGEETLPGGETFPGERGQVLSMPNGEWRGAQRRPWDPG